MTSEFAEYVFGEGRRQAPFFFGSWCSGAVVSKAPIGLAMTETGLDVRTVRGYVQRRSRSGRWVLLGSQRVGFGFDRNVVRVGRQDGKFSAIKLRVRDNDIEMLDVKVV